MRPSSRQALGRFLSNIDWLVLENVEDINEKYAFFNNIIIMGIWILLCQQRLLSSIQMMFHG